MPGTAGTESCTHPGTESGTHAGTVGNPDSVSEPGAYTNAGASGAVIPSEDWNVSLKPRLVCGHAECSRIWGLE